MKTNYSEEEIRFAYEKMQSQIKPFQDEISMLIAKAGIIRTYEPTKKSLVDITNYGKGYEFCEEQIHQIHKEFDEKYHFFDFT